MKILNTITSLATATLIMLFQACGGNETPKVDCTKVSLSVQISTVNADCPQSNGKITVMASGSGDTYEYSIDGTTFQADNVFDNLSGDDYQVTVRDVNGCTSSYDIKVSEVSHLSFDYTASAAGCTTSTGGLSITAANGDGNYQYKLGDGSFQASSEFTGLAYGDYTVTAKDGGDCQTISDVYVPSGISYQTSVTDIMTANCAVTGCHVAGTGRTDFAIFSVIQANAEDIKTRTQSGNMPSGSTLTDEQKQTIACWVDDGAKDN